MLINSIECAAGAKFLQNRPSTRRVYFLKSTALSAPQARKFCKIASVQSGVADPVCRQDSERIRGFRKPHSTEFQFLTETEDSGFQTRGFRLQRIQDSRLQRIRGFRIRGFIILLFHTLSKTCLLQKNKQIGAFSNTRQVLCSYGPPRGVLSLRGSFSKFSTDKRTVVVAPVVVVTVICSEISVTRVYSSFLVNTIRWP